MKVAPLKPHEAALLRRRKRNLLTEQDLMLELLERVRPRGVQLSKLEIAEICGWTDALIYLEELTALRRLQFEAQARGLNGVERLLAA